MASWGSNLNATGGHVNTGRIANWGGVGGDYAGLVKRVGAPVVQRIVCAFFGFQLLTGYFGEVIAAEQISQAAGTGTRFATVMRIRGEVTVSAGDTAPPRTLRQGDPLFVG